MTAESFVVLFGIFVVGIGLGLAHFWALNWTVVGVAEGRFGVAVLLLSSAVRFAFFALAFVWLLDGEWQRGLACLLGALVGRQVILRWHRVPDAT